MNFDQKQKVNWEKLRVNLIKSKQLVSLNQKRKVLDFQKDPVKQIELIGFGSANPGDLEPPSPAKIVLRSEKSMKIPPLSKLSSNISR